MRITDGLSAQLQSQSTSSKNKEILIIGNGPSTKDLSDFGFDNLPPHIDTFGMGAAYRFYETINWWPTYYAWCDVKVVHSHQKALKALIENPAIDTERFFFSLPISDNPRLETIQHSSTGDFCFRKAVELGYQKIYLIGMEGHYVEELTESRRLTEAEYESLGFDKVFPEFQKAIPDHVDSVALFLDTLRIIENTPDKNPNYFFEGYQRAGDVFSKPRAQTHRNSWSKSADLIKDTSVQVVNLSETSQIESFHKAPWKAFEEMLSFDNTKAPFSPYGRPAETPTPLTSAKRSAFLKEAGLEDTETLSTLIIGVRLPDNEPERPKNLLFLLDWIDHFYGDFFDILLVEQDSISKIDTIKHKLRPYVRREFIYNPGPFNRGWGYNVAVKHFTTAKVVALMDTDVLTGENFVQEIVDCHHKYKAVSPYASVYFTEAEETAKIIVSFNLNHLDDIERISKPVTLTGGITIVRRDVFYDIAGFEQYTEYAGEDRSLDVTLLNECKPEEIRIAPFTYAHLYHPTGGSERPNMKALFAHLREHYGCWVDQSLTPEEYVHKNCNHVPKEKTRSNSAARLKSFGDANLYRSGRPLKINGVYAAEEAAASSEKKPSTNAIFPPAFKTLDAYEQREIFDAPPPDTERLAKLYNRFKGERCFIVGNGPSLNKHDLSLLKDEHSFAVNSIYYKTDESGYRPTFFVVEDSSVMKENIDRIRDYDAPYKFFPTNYKELHPPGDNTYFFKMNRGFYEKSSPYYCMPRFSADASKVLYCGQSVTYINLQLAYFLGFTEVFLIGMDFSYIIPNEHKRSGDLITSTTDDPNHFHKDYFGVGKTWKDPKLERVAMNYHQAKLAYEAVGRKIYNATKGGHLEVFDRVDYDELLSEGRMKITPSAKSLSMPVQPQDANQQPTPSLAKPTSATTHNSPPPAQKRPFYAEAGDRFRETNPRMFNLLKIVRMGMAGIWRRRVWTLPVLAIIGAAVAFSFSDMAEGRRAILWIGSGFAFLFFVTAYIGLRSYQNLQALSAGLDAMRKSISSYAKADRKTEKSLTETGMRLVKAERSLGDVDRLLGKAQGRIEELSTLHTGVEKNMQSIDRFQSAIVKRVRETENLLRIAADKQAGLNDKLNEHTETEKRLERENVSMDTLSALRALRAFWLEGSAVARLKQETTREHGHALLMATLADEEKQSPGTLAHKNIIEIGTTRELRLPQNSTRKLAIFALATDMRFVTVDMDPKNTNEVNKVLPYINPGATAWAQKGEVYLRTFAESLDYVYLDLFDFNHNEHSDARRERYKEILHTDITDEACWMSHKECAEVIIDRMPQGGIVALDDTWLDAEANYCGKGKLAVPMLLEAGFEIVAQTKETICLKRVK